MTDIFSSIAPTPAEGWVVTSARPGARPSNTTKRPSKNLCASSQVPNLFFAKGSSNVNMETGV